MSNDTCHFARHGGEEFVMLFEGQSTAAACEIVDAARIDLSSRTLINKNTGERLETVSFSAGIADVTAYDDAREALRAADAAMRTEGHTSELQAIMRTSYAVFCLNKKQHIPTQTYPTIS